MAAQIKAEYEKFMEEMKNVGDNDETLNNLTGMLGGLLKNLGDELGE